MEAPRRPKPLPPSPQPLPRPATDAHTHMLSTEAFSGLTVDAALAAARDVNVTRLVEVGVDIASSRDAVRLASQHPEVIANIAIHPNEAARLGDTQLRRELEELVRLAESRVKTVESARPDAQMHELSGIRGIGETGLDYFRTTDSVGKRLQRDAFVAHIELARRTGLTLVIHDRDAHDDVLAVLDDTGLPERIVMHCFSGDADFAAKCVERGAWLSFPGTVTFAPNEALRDAARTLPSERLLVETDAPYLTPMPMRGRPNSSYLLPHTVAFLAELRGIELGDFCDLVTANAAAAFGGPW